MKWFLCLLPMVLAFSPAFACPQGLTVREAVYSYEIDRVEAILAAVQRDFAAGSRSADDLACAYAAFSAVRPDTAEFVGHWLDRHPGSPFAMTAKALVLKRFSREVRGDKPASLTYVGALIEARDMLYEADRLGRDAIDLVPDLELVLTWQVVPEPSGELLEALRHNPADPNLIKLLQAQTESEDMAKLAEDLVTLFPYAPEHWDVYASAHPDLSTSEEEAIRINQVVYANHTPGALLAYLRWKANARGDTCPFVRALRLHRRACAFAQDRACNLDAGETAAFNAIYDEASQSGQCFEARNLPLSHLPFKALPFPS